MVRSITFKVGWVLLLLVAGLWTLGHIALIFANSEERALFLGWSAFTLCAFLVIAFPFRQGARRAWVATWIPVAAFAGIMFISVRIGLWYLGSAAIMVVGLLLTARTFFSPGLTSP
jgi:hypothetical protein